jgi:alkylhydroperoxidase/carboxymuconolactone decarboxylase family protein YurZ
MDRFNEFRSEMHERTTYHLQQCIDLGITDAELHDAMNVGLVVGGSIVIPHLRRAFARIEEIRGAAQGG